MDKDRSEATAAIAHRGEQKICRGIRPPSLPDKPVLTDRTADPEDRFELSRRRDNLQLQLQARLLAGTARLTRK